MDLLEPSISQLQERLSNLFVLLFQRFTRQQPRAQLNILPDLAALVTEDEDLPVRERLHRHRAREVDRQLPAVFHGRAIRQLLREVFPQLSDRPLIDQHLCWFADTDDSDFIIDYVPDTNGTLAVLSGDSGHGFKMLPIFGTFVHKLLVEGRQDERKWQWKDGKSKIAAVWRSSESQELAGVPRAKL